MTTSTVGLERLVYLTELTGLRLEGPNGARIGRVREAAVAPREHPRRVSRYLFGDGKTRFQIRHDQIREITLDRILLADDQFIPYYMDESHLLLDRDLLDQQIVDVNGRKVVRVNDVALRIERTNAHDELWVHEVGVGLQAAFRRLTEGVLPHGAIRKLQTRFKKNSIPWEYCNIVEPDPQRRLKLRISHDRIGQLHPADVADIIEELGPAERGALFETLDDTVAAQALEEIDPKLHAAILHSLDKERVAEILDEMEPDAAADLLNSLEEAESDEILEEMEDEPAADIEELLEYSEDSAGGMMTNYFLAVPQDSTVEDAIVAMREHDYLAKSLTHVFLTDDEERLVAAVPIGRLFLGAPDQPLRPLAFRETPRVDLEAERERVIETFDKYNCYSLPVTDELGVLKGVITADDVIAVLKK
jgi:flagellar motility protein MotE (MotC chaperone)/sporulation protein YlmC with PRC-barrel domain